MAQTKKKIKKGYFEGWYFKNQNDKNTIAFIPAFHIDKEGNKSSSVQIITEEGSYCAQFSGDEFSVKKDKFCVQIGNNVFFENGLRVDISQGGYSVKGELQFSSWTTPKSDVMGPFRFLPFLQCNHGVFSLTHQLSGSLTVNGKQVSFDGGTGYVETDWGSSFPKSYLWTQCCFESSGANNSVMLSVADIPVLGTHFTGCICAILFGGREYRLATYHGVKIKSYHEHHAFIEQNGYTLEVSLVSHNPHPLKAPNFGSMTRVIKESPSCTVRYRFCKKEKVLFDITSDQASFEVSGLSAKK